jgi:hypothetical protein
LFLQIYKDSRLVVVVVVVMVMEVAVAVVAAVAVASASPPPPPLIAGVFHGTSFELVVSRNHSDLKIVVLSLLHITLNIRCIQFLNEGFRKKIRKVYFFQ